VSAQQALNVSLFLVKIVNLLDVYVCQVLSNEPATLIYIFNTSLTIGPNFVFPVYCHRIFAQAKRNPTIRAP